MAYTAKDLCPPHSIFGTQEKQKVGGVKEEKKKEEENKSQSVDPRYHKGRG